MDPITDKDFLLANTSETSLTDRTAYEELPKTKRSYPFKPIVTIILACCLLLSFAYNVILSLRVLSRTLDPYRCRSPYSQFLSLLESPIRC